MDNIFKRLDFVSNESKLITSYYDGKPLDEVGMFCMCMLDRLNFSCLGLKELIENFPTKPQVEYSCGIILRAALLDYLIVLNAFEIMGRDKPTYEDLKNYCLIMLCDSVRNTLDYFESLEGSQPKEKIAMLYKNLVATNSRCFEPYFNDGSKPVIKVNKYKSPKELFKTLVASKDMKQYKNVYTAYLFYSKYDHFGNVFYGLSRISPSEQLKNMDNAIRELPKVLMFVTGILSWISPNDIFINDRRLNSMSFVESFKQNNQNR